jgi:hypothetical protein
VPSMVLYRSSCSTRGHSIESCPWGVEPGNVGKDGNVCSIERSISAAKLQVRIHAGKHPLLLYGLYGPKRKYRSRLVDRATLMVIEGFPRSVKTLAVALPSNMRSGKGSVSLTTFIYRRRLFG